MTVNKVFISCAAAALLLLLLASLFGYVSTNEASHLSNNTQALHVESNGLDARERSRLLNEERRQWQQKIELYRIELKLLLAGRGVSELDSGALNGLRAEYFSGPELTRIAALDKAELEME